jgi:diaminohydroxyphosphoribosylaminopyrimidine deaminase/5-amino-6-(5-phosphoribosylamino)uracil reductase
MASDVDLDRDERFMRLALDEARKGSPSPNPHVGAVIVQAQSDVVIGRGFHPRAGEEHAETMALREAGESARGATLYVTLEPCNHHGRTPPCTDAVLAAGIARVVVGMRDPNPTVAGGGDSRLRASGVEVVEDVLSEPCTRLLRPWTKHVTTRRPYVRLKLASSLDGRIAAAPHASRPDAPRGVSRWITGSEARRRVHELRAQVDAVAVGIETALADDPELLPRDAASVEGRDPPTRIVIDSTLRLLETSRLVQTAGKAPVLVVTADDASIDLERRLVASGVEVERAPRGADGRLDLASVLDLLGKLELVDLLVEGGARLAGALIEAGLVDELTWYVAPIVLGNGGAPAVVGPSPITPEAAPRWIVESITRAGEDVELSMLPRRLV